MTLTTGQIVAAALGLVDQLVRFIADGRGNCAINRLTHDAHGILVAHTVFAVGRPFVTRLSEREEPVNSHSSCFAKAHICLF